MSTNRLKTVALLEALESARQAAHELTGDPTTDTLFRRIALRIAMKTGVEADGLLGADQRRQ